MTEKTEEHAHLDPLSLAIEAVEKNNPRGFDDETMVEYRKMYTSLKRLEGALGRLDTSIKSPWPSGNGGNDVT